MNASLQRLPAEPADRFTHALARFLRIEALAGGALLFAAMLAIVLANTPWSAGYLAFWETAAGLRWADVQYLRSIRSWLTDGAMTLFFFLVALELKREIVIGELRDRRKAAFSLAGALGGMLVPALTFSAIQRGQSGSAGWGIVMATDTALVVGCLALLGARVPHGLRLFLLSLAIFDDVGAVLVVAFGYAHAPLPVPLAMAVSALAAMLLLRWLGIRAIGAYVVTGILVWLAFDCAGVHPTIAGVGIGLMTPTRRWVSERRLHAILRRVIAHPRSTRWRTDTTGRENLRRARIAAREALSPLERLEMRLHPWIAFAVLPLFALANAGIAIEPAKIDWRLTASVVAGLTLAKPIGVMAFCATAERLGLARRPHGLRWTVLAAGTLLTGIGFTMSLLLAGLALAPPYLASAKLGILCSSALSAVLGLSALAWSTSNGQRSSAAPTVTAISMDGAPAKAHAGKYE